MTPLPSGYCLHAPSARYGSGPPYAHRSYGAPPDQAYSGTGSHHHATGTGPAARSGRSDNFQRLPPHRLITSPPRPGFDINGYALAGYHNFEDDRQRANADRQRADAERQRVAAYDRQRADDDRQRADAEHQRAIAAEQQAMRVQQQRVTEHAESTRLHSVSQLQTAQLSAQVEALTRMLQHPAPTTPATPASEGSAEGTNQSATTASAPAPPPPPPPPSIPPVNLTDAAAPVFEAEEAPAFAAFARSFKAGVAA